MITYHLSGDTAFLWFLNNLIDILARTTEGAGKKATQEFKDLFKKRLAGYSSNTFEIFRSKSNIFSAFRRYQPTDEVFTTAQKVFAKSTGATENEARQIIDEILDQAYRVKDPSNLPDFKYTSKTMQTITQHHISKQHITQCSPCIGSTNVGRTYIANFDSNPGFLQKF